MAIDFSDQAIYDNIATPASPASGVSRLFATGDQICEKDPSGQIYSQPRGTWIRLATANPSIADNTAVTVITTTNVADGDILAPMWPAMEEDTANIGYVNGVAASLPGSVNSFAITKTTVTDEFLFQYRQNSGAARTVFFILYKVTI